MRTIQLLITVLSISIMLFACGNQEGDKTPAEKDKSATAETKVEKKDEPRGRLGAGSR